MRVWLMRRRWQAKPLPLLLLLAEVVLTGQATKSATPMVHWRRQQWQNPVFMIAFATVKPRRR